MKSQVNHTPTYAQDLRPLSNSISINRTISFTFLFLLLGIYNLHAQKTIAQKEAVKVLNDDAAGAITLFVDSAYYPSTTTNCTIEEACIDRALTAKCLVYHNDQWFNFRTTDSVTYYLLVKNQNCRDIKGVQLLVIDGCICQPATYNILECISLATQDDISLALNKLKPNHSYIINLDGYLNDFCKFEISISTRPPDFHLRTDLPVAVKTTVQNDKIEFAWQLNEELINLGVTEFEILRRFQLEKKFSHIKKVAVERRVSGSYEIDYSTIDSVNRSGMYYYKVLALTSEGEKFLLSEHSFHLDISYRNPYVIFLDLDVKRKTVLNIDMYSYPFERFLGNYKAAYNDNFHLDLKPYVPADERKVKLVITDLTGKFKKEMIIDIQ